MADIYIVYASEDRDVAEKLHKLLSEQWDTWLDAKIVGDFAEVIESEIPKAGCIVPLYSSHSRIKSTVTDELRLGKKHKKVFLPIRLDDSEPPYSFGSDSIIDMRGWDGEVEHPGFTKLKRNLSTIVTPKEKPKRPHYIVDNRIPLPTIFLSVSSFNTKITPSDAAKALNAFNAPTILVSAYDLISRDVANDGYEYDHQPVLMHLKKYQNNGGFILLDSGNYEASRFKGSRWDNNYLRAVLECTPHNWAFCFDNLEPSLGHNISVKQIVEAVKRDQEFSPGTVLPVIHAPKLKKGGYQLDYVPQIIREISEKLTPPLIAIPERELGAGLISRAKMVREIRTELNKLPYYQPLHLLGTGNPCAISVLAAAGADSFDGLEWCRYMIDTDLEKINHFDFFDLFAKEYNEHSEFAANVAYNNIEYFKSFGNIMHDMFTHGKSELFVHEIINNKQAFSKLKDSIPGFFE